MAPSKQLPTAHAASNNTTALAKSATAANEKQQPRPRVVYDADQLPAGVKVDDPVLSTTPTSVPKKRPASGLTSNNANQPPYDEAFLATLSKKARKRLQRKALQKDQKEQKRQASLQQTSKDHQLPRVSAAPEPAKPQTTTTPASKNQQSLSLPSRQLRPRPAVPASEGGYKQTTRAAAGPQLTKSNPKPAPDSTPTHSASANRQRTSSTPGAITSTGYKPVHIGPRSRATAKQMFDEELAPQSKPKPKSKPKLLVCVKCGEKYDPDTVDFGSCWKHTERYGRVYPDRSGFDHWSNTVGDDDGVAMWLCCKNRDPKHPGCHPWIHCQK